MVRYALVESTTVHQSLREMRNDTRKINYEVRSHQNKEHVPFLFLAHLSGILYTRTR